VLETYRPAIEAFVADVKSALGERLVSVVLFGSVADGRARAESDVDVLLVVHDLPAGPRRRRALVAEATDHAEALLQRSLPHAFFSLVMKTPAEVELGGPLFYDMTLSGKAEMLVDRGGFMARFVVRLKERMAALGSVRRTLHGHPYWDLKPDWKPGDVIDL
jgi:predicted nucleotidyltransferase